MKFRRWALVALVLCVAVGGIGPAYALGGGYFAWHIQRVPVIEWTAPGSEPLDGLGQWVYVAPIPPAGPDQLPTTGYVYGPGFVSAGGRGVVGLSRDDQGPIAGIQLVPPAGGNPAPVTIRYDWSPGKFYFLLVHQLGEDRWGGWVFDHAASAWTFIGSVQAATGSGLLSPTSVTRVGGAHSSPQPAFSQINLGAIRGPCRLFPQVDAYAYPPVGYRWTGDSQMTVAHASYSLGDCPTQMTIEADWLHMRLGWPPIP